VPEPPRNKPFPHLIRLGLLAVAAVAAVATAGCGGSCPVSDGAASPTAETTPLEDYVAAPDEAYKYRQVALIQEDGYDVHVLRMTSQAWMTRDVVDRTTWWHWLTIVVPAEVEGDVAALLLAGGRRNTEQPGHADETLVRTALATHSVVASLHNVPFQPIEFAGDDFGPRKEDELIAYGWRKFLEGGARDEDAQWLPRLPMTKAAVRAMDTITEYCAEQGLTVERYVVTGASKRGWTAWTTAVVDSRVIAIAPAVIDLLNVEESFDNHWRSYGFWSPAVDDFEREGVMEWQGTPEFRRLLEIVDPYSYRERLKLPKLILNGVGDPFFLPDSWRFYWDGLEGEKHLRYIPNTDHSMRGTDVAETFAAFYDAVRKDVPRPHYEWRVEQGVLHLVVDTDHPPAEIRLWRASNPEARDFRLGTIGKSWVPEPVEPRDDGIYRFEVEPPERGWTAFYAELAWKSMLSVPFKVSTGVAIVPDTLPFPPYESPRSAAAD
jgi:PhoPQ-activated pathogenicity-related protein